MSQEDVDFSAFEDIDLSAFVAGMILLSIGCGLQWGWPASLIALGGVLAGWPLIKSTIKRLK